MLRVGVIGVDGLATAQRAVEVVVKVLHLLVAGEEHEPSGALRDGLDVLLVQPLVLGRHVSRYVDPGE